jgi:hypothetical protein
MVNKQIASLGCKFLGIYALIQSIPLIGNFFQMLSLVKDDPSFGVGLFLSTFLPFLIMAASGLALIIFSRKFAHKMVPSVSVTLAEQGLSSKDIQSIAFSVVGLVLIVIAIPKIFQIGWNIYALQSAGDQRNTQELLQRNWSFTLATGIQFIIGLFLYIGSELIATAWHFIITRLKYEKNITTA